MAIPFGMSLHQYKKVRDEEKQRATQKEEVSKKRNTRRLKRKSDDNDDTTLRRVKPKQETGTSTVRPRACAPCRKMKTKCGTRRPCDRCVDKRIDCVQGRSEDVSPKSIYSTHTKNPSKPRSSVHIKKSSLPIATNDNIMAQKRAIEILSKMLHKTKK